LARDVDEGACCIATEKPYPGTLDSHIYHPTVQAVSSLTKMTFSTGRGEGGLRNALRSLSTVGAMKVDASKTWNPAMKVKGFILVPEIHLYMTGIVNF
jgi:CTP-dependent riboflavin kinase